ncbi:hypothetical protein SAMN04488029_2855 [Reichenbachiella faecimaris]|uniref:Uncharacterized protein n=1 Tax=Reichenbachiella faecimaris TaxID=692418 RepID=A0A1W2GIA0_REIFA|nr:hypothetical protein [Reichenbachiella faecimaris]SMD36367.1 hypothetical protein SAMN04488029_2855 [Reichenbachiella faecimaris]
MIDIRADVSRNILILHLEGFLTDDELMHGVNLCISESNKLKDGYTIINDISKMKPASPAGAAEIKRAQAHVINNGVSRVIRITQNPITKIQLNRTSGEVGYQAYEVSTRAEAYALIES